MSARKVQGFRWTEKAEKAALALAQGKTRVDAAREAGIDEATIYRWLKHSDFSDEVDRLTMTTDFATRAERVRIGKRAANRRMIAEEPFSKKDLLDWLKFIQSETDGEVSDLGRYLAKIAHARNLDPDAVLKLAQEIAGVKH